MPAITPDGRFVTFTSHATNLARGDGNGACDVFVRDRAADTTELISVSSLGEQGDGDSFGSSLSGDGRFVAFTSYSSNLVPGDGARQFDVYLRDRRLGTTRRVSTALNGAGGDGMSFRAAISEDGRFVTFNSAASNLVSAKTDGLWNTYVRDLVSGTTELASVGLGGMPADRPCKGSAISADGRFVAFTSSAMNLVSAAAAPGDAVFIRDRQAGVTERVSVNSQGVPADAACVGWSMSADGRFVAFGSRASNLVPGAPGGIVQIYVRDRALGVTERVSVNSEGTPTDGSCHFIPLVSGDGRFVAFASTASNLVPGGPNGMWQMFIHDRAQRKTTRISVGDNGSPADGPSATDSVGVGISANGRFTTFTSAASNLSPGTGDEIDVYVRDRLVGVTERISVAARTLPALNQQRSGGRGVLPVCPGKATRAAAVMDHAAPAVDEGAAGGLHNNRWLHVHGAASVTPPGGTAGEITATADAHLEVPFFTRTTARFSRHRSTLAWWGEHPFNADTILHTDAWEVDAFPAAVEIDNIPPGAVQTAPGRLEWQTETANSWVSEHEWGHVSFRVRGILYRSCLTVTGSFQFGSAFFVVEEAASACT